LLASHKREDTCNEQHDRAREKARIKSQKRSDLTLLLLPVVCRSLAIAALQKKLAVRHCHTGHNNAPECNSKTQFAQAVKYKLVCNVDDGLHSSSTAPEVGAWDAGLLAEVPQVGPQVGPQVVEVEVRFCKAGAGADQPPTLISLQRLQTG